VIASDARLFHLDVDVTAAALPAPVIAFETNSQMGSESLTLQLGPTPSDTYPQIVATRDRDSLFQFGPLGQHSRAVKVSGKPATIWTTDAHPTETLIWQPLPGVWATVTYIGDNPTIRVAEAVRFNRVMRCAVPFTLATVAPGAWMDSCTVSADAAGVTANVEVRIQKGWGVLVKSLPRADAQPVHPTTRINGRPASTSREPIDGGSGFIDHIRIDYGARIVEFVGFIVQGPTLLQVAQGFRPIAGNDPNHWPSTPLT